MSTETTTPSPASKPHSGGVNPGFGKFMAGLVIGLVVGLPAGAYLPTVLGLTGSAIAGANEKPQPGGTGQPSSRGKVPVTVSPATSEPDREPRRAVPRDGPIPPAPAPGEPKPMDPKPGDPKPAEPAPGGSTTPPAPKGG